MASLTTLAKITFENLIEWDIKAEGWYLHPADYTQDVEALVESSRTSYDALAKLVEAALAADDAQLFLTLCEYNGWETFESVVTDYFGLSAFFVYGSHACLIAYLDLHLDDPDTWVKTREERLFDTLETDFWELDWAPAWRNNPLGILYLLHYKGGISARSLLKKCIQCASSAFYAPLLALGAAFEVDDLYLADHTLDDLKTLLNEGLLDTLKENAAEEDWVYLTETLLALV